MLGSGFLESQPSMGFGRIGLPETERVAVCGSQGEQ